MDVILNRPHLIAYFAGTIFPFTCFISYVLALVLDHIGPWITYISDASTDPPISGIFGMLLSYSMLAFLATAYLRKQLIDFVFEERPEIATSKVRLFNNLSVLFALTSVICLIFVAHFQVHTSIFLHGTMAFVGIGLGVIYCCFQVVCTKAMIPFYTAPSLLYLRLALSVLSAIAFAFGVLSGLLSIHKFKGKELHRWAPEDGGYLEHAVSSVCEWILALVYSAYIMSFAHEFKNIRIRTMKVAWKGPDNDAKLDSSREDA
ncbi:DNA damage-regulated autophagy modulator protein 1-like [Neocloeon triangulifer]|uniref:DNA damage-regulated autophagy modulator protein 1-like n=1 Tax=Neocloeon triangulifer TaxID=2078957 RepID=UPI00286EE863|nr:DNA damage-regulated autophagy modulator protein 1-like [Neocloeon triangulifer]XP_059472167.1 DNA damage-regulated autophagy modulator protein 1-like [Neocloeon triangulifer]XP_059472168.1 DNA damage-regulated autophagy modulator protein 1-like [Neocloeon triangulifer]XP_059472169.1 DNA damage-regulated autophagy modulator protein 1-like [Neocloeon triangulifer]